MTSLSKRYERLKKIPEELRIQSALPAPAHEQTPSQTLGRKRKHIELEPETRIPRLECNRALPKNSGIDKVGMEALVSYLVAASMVKSPENARFSMKLRKLIAEHPEQVSSIIRLLKKRDLRWRWKVGCEGGCEKSGCLMIGGGGDDGCGGLVGFSRGMFGDNERVISNEEMLWIVFDGALGALGEEVVMGEGVVVTSSSLEMLINSYLGGIMVSLIFLEGFEEEAFVEFMVVFS
ncbi:hypothetical protein Tco_0544955 [Tanacetum coccineum]